ncbi:type 1 glutamine amidotransferase domain-containing protein [Mycolicibacterium baixiangningiae]|uniref:type 1 glutamine amidotransferase domain-containing protein n=1 Tax=Mycolicibacterium baixiangningiae TaxID=2761578 RepID=UPI001E34C386|nr:type 1 glutamine amidotransferase domain-containing protein [Mycolicibacterium baixiangningiae]
MNTKGKVLIVGSSSHTFELRSGRHEPTGYYLNELAVPARSIVDAGYEAVLATPKGTAPVVEQFSVNADYFDGSATALEEAIEFVATSPGLRTPRSIRSTIEEGLDGYAGVFLPGGHPPMIDLMHDPDLGEALRHFHTESKPTALLCHGPIALTAAMPRAKEFRRALVKGDPDAAQTAAQGWQYRGYRMTVFSNEEEKWAEQNILKGEQVLFYPADALTAAGGAVESRGAFECNVVHDRELITGQNPFSDRPFADLFVAELDRSR